VGPDQRVGVVVITRNRPEVIHAVGRLLQLPSQPSIVVVDNGSTDGTPEAIVRTFSAVRLIRLPENHGATARNIGVKALARPFIAFCDDDVWWEPGSLSHGADLFEAHPRLGAISARLLVGERSALDPTCAEMAASPLPRDASFPGVPVLGFVAGAAMVRTQAFIEAGGFERRFGVGGEEELLAIDLAASDWRIAYVPGDGRAPSSITRPGT
jgi:GT2 family glycosyltransferase